MLLWMHGAAGGWDELAIAAVALAVLWIAVKLAGRKPATEDDEAEAAADTAATADEGQPESARPSPTKLG